MAIKIIQLVSVLFCIWIYVDLQRAIHRQFLMRHSELMNKLSDADGYDRRQAAMLTDDIAICNTLAHTKKQRRLMQQCRQIWQDKFGHLFYDKINHPNH